MSKSSILILQGSQHSTTPKLHKPGLILVDSPKYHKECLIKPGENLILDLPKPQGCELLKKSKYLEVDNYLSEYDTEEKKAIIRKHLLIEGHALWGNVLGYLEDLLDLVDFIDSKIGDLTPTLKKLETALELLLTEVNENLHKKVTIENEEETEASKQILYLIKNSDLKLNLDFANALNSVLGGSDINSIDDAISILLYKMFPITYTDWSISVTNTATKSYSIEKGTTQTITPSSELGTITILLNEGNKGDTPVSLTVNGTDILETNKTTYSISVKFSDVTNQTNIDSSKEKSYEIILTTTSNTVQTTTKASITVSNTLYYFFDSGIDKITDIRNEAIKQTSNEYLFNLGDSKLYLSIFSPKPVTRVDCKGGTEPDGLDSEWRKLSEYSNTLLSYTPANGTPQTYYRITLDTPLSKSLKIKVT